MNFFLNSQNLNDLKPLFLKGNRSSFFEKILTQIFMIFGRAGSEGGLFNFFWEKKPINSYLRFNIEAGSILYLKPI